MEIERHKFVPMVGNPEWCGFCGEHRNYAVHDRPFWKTLLLVMLASAFVGTVLANVSIYQKVW